MKYKELSESKQ